jgi:hypothetical protein
VSWLAAVALPLALAAVGRRIMGRARGMLSPGASAVLALLAGALAFYLALALFTLLGIPWTRWTLLAALALLVSIPRRALGWLQPARDTGRGSHPGEAPSALRLGWGDLAAASFVVAFTLLAVTLWVTTPDFVYHWGLKAERFALARAIDFRFLALLWNGGPGIHPDYPNLLPSLYAATAVLARRFDAHALMLWPVVWFIALLAALRGALQAARVRRWTAQATMATTAAIVTTFALGNVLAGGADWMIALALAAAVPALCGLAGEAGDLQVGLAAAFAAASKIEGVPVAAFLVVAHLFARAARDGLRSPRALGGVALRSGLPPAAAIVPWLVETARHGLFQAGNSGPFDWGRRREIWRGVREVAGSAPLHGLPWALALLPLLWLSRRTRALAAVLSAQALFYAWAYFASPIDPWLYVLSNGSRLAFQLLPAVLVGAVIATEPREVAT